MGSRLWLVFVVALSACTPDVIVGINVRSDAGADDASVQLDAGAEDGGPGDGGGGDAGAGDAGPGDGGAGDAGGGDGGAGDAGVGDGGADAGSVDAGVDAGAPGDGGPVDLLLDFTGDVVIDQLSTAAYTVRALNLGGTTALDASVFITLPAGLALRSSATCTIDGGVLTCPVGDVLPGLAGVGSFVLETDAGPGWRDLLGVVTTASPDADAGNDGTTFFMAVTEPSAQVFPLAGPRSVDITFCVGMGLTSFAMCTPPSYVTGSIVLLSDGGLESDAGFYGQWSQSPHQRNVAWRFYLGSTFGARYSGVAVGACFEGVLDVNGMYNRGAFRGCPQ